MTVFEFILGVLFAVNCGVAIYISHQLDDVNEVLRRPYVGQPLPVREDQ